MTNHPPTEPAVDVAAGLLVPTLSAEAFDRLAVVAARYGVAEDLVLAALFQGFLFRYTRGEAELGLLVTGTSRERPALVPSFVARGRSIEEVVAHLREAIPDRGFPGAESGGALLAWRDGTPMPGSEPGAVLGAVASLRWGPEGLATSIQVKRPPSAAWGEESFLAHWRTFVTAAVLLPDEPLAHLPLVGADEFDIIAGPLSGATVPAPALPAETLPELFAARAFQHGDRIACVGEDRSLTYGELDRRANQVARHLRFKGVRRGDSVGLYIARCADAFVAMLGILKAGAAFVPIDPDYPPDRVFYILKDAGARAVLTTAALAARTQLDGVAVLSMDGDWAAMRFEAEDPLPDGPSVHDVAYVIYTSGSTGRPKGVMVEHRNVLAFIAAEAALFPLTPDDRVYQGFSLAFDAAVEEVWLAFQAGARLVIPSAAVARSGPGVASFLNEQGVTVFSTVPTQLMMMDDPLPAVRLLILGGEECTPSLVQRWSRAGRRLVNTYGPTEATVVATAADTAPGARVTIGRPLPGVRAYVLDERQRPLPVGIAGELCLGGPGIARGYVGRPELTADKFPPAPQELGGGRLYRTGDLARFTDEGNLEFLGRIDSQVKLRGYRIELGEIETLLAAEPGVKNAAVLLREDQPGMMQLVAYLVPADRNLSTGALRDVLKAKLPAYMVPAHLVVVPSLPTLPSGKIDRRALPPPADAAPPRAPSHGTPPATALERDVHAIWASLFHPQAVAMEDDFFALGGHSLLATRLLSELRRDPRFAGASVLDVYGQPVLRDFCAHLGARMVLPKLPDGPICPTAATPTKPRPAYALCVVLQLASIYAIYAVVAAQWLVPFFGYRWYAAHGSAWRPLLAAAALLWILRMPVRVACAVGLKWLLVGRMKPGRYPLWSAYYWRFWLVRRLLGWLGPAHLAGTPFFARYFRMLGAAVGDDVHLGKVDLAIPDLVTIGRGASIGHDVQIQPYAFRDGWLDLAPVTIGAGATIGARSVVELGATVGDGATVGELSLVGEQQVVPAGEHWVGSPARPRKRVSMRAGSEYAEPRGRPLGRGEYRSAAALVLALIPLASAVALAPGALLFWLVAARFGYPGVLAAAPVAVGLGIVSWCLVVAGVKWMIGGRQAPGRYRVASWAYLRHFVVERLLSDSLEAVFPLYATLYLVPWLRLLGMRVGRRAEVSTAAHFTPDLVALGDGCFLADAVCLGSPWIERGVMTLRPLSIGAGSFVGNSALLPGGATLGDDCLIGCQSQPPLRHAESAVKDTSWVGSPGVRLPRRQTSAEFDEAYTFRPTAALHGMRLACEAVKVVLPDTVNVSVGVGCWWAFGQAYAALPLGAFLAASPLVIGAAGAAGALAVVILKWLLVGRYKPGVRPLWSHFVWRTEIVAALHEQVGIPQFLGLMQGTPLAPLYFRLLGSHIGRRVVMETTNLTEFDLVEVGDRATLGTACDLQTHLFEDRVMKMARVHVGADASVGASSVVLYDAEMGVGSSLASLSLLMKGERLPAGTRWEGSPVVRVPV